MRVRIAGLLHSVSIETARHIRCDLCGAALWADHWWKCLWGFSAPGTISSGGRRSVGRPPRRYLQWSNSVNMKADSGVQCTDWQRAVPASYTIPTVLRHRETFRNYFGKWNVHAHHGRESSLPWFIRPTSGGHSRWVKFSLWMFFPPPLGMMLLEESMGGRYGGVVRELAAHLSLGHDAPVRANPSTLRSVTVQLSRVPCQAYIRMSMLIKECRTDLFLVFRWWVG